LANKKLGKFISDGKIYRIDTPKTPTRWYNYLFNDKYILNVSQTLQGAGSFIENDSTNEHTGNHRHFYWLDRASGDIFCPCYQPLKSYGESFECNHGLGHSGIRALYKGIDTKIRVFVPTDSMNEIWTITVTNRTNQTKDLSFFSAFPLRGGGTMGGECRFIHDKQILYKYAFPYHVFYNDKEKVENNIAYSYVFSDKEIHSYDGSLQRFYGCDDVTEIPLAIKNGECSSIDGEGENAFEGVLEHRFILETRQSFSFNIILGAAKSKEEIFNIKKQYSDEVSIQNAFEAVKNLWDKRTKSFFIETGKKDFDSLVNYWLKKQVILLARLNRLTPYCPVRNQLQDALGYSLIDADEALEYALKVLRRQRKDGFLKMWYMTDGSPDEKLCLINHSDGGIWLILCMLEIIDNCGDEKIFERLEGYIDSDEKTSIYQHLLKAAYYLNESVGSRGLCLMKDGDWTDPINGAGRLGKGESTWLSMALVYCAKRLAAICERKNDFKNKNKLLEIAKRLEHAINTHCWDGKWYIVGYDDNGVPFGTQNDKEGQIFLNAQTWAIISGCATGERLKQCKEAIAKCDTPFGSLLLTPAFSQWNPIWGRLSIKQKGTTENGSVYCHATMFKAFADCIVGDVDAAFKSIIQTLPINPQNAPEKNLQVPLFVPNYYFGLSDSANFGRSSLHYGTGTTSWLLWVFIEQIAGVKATIDGIKFEPSLPQDIKQINIKRWFKGQIHEFNA